MTTCRRTPNHGMLLDGCRQIPRTRQTKGRCQRAELCDSAAVVGRADADRSTQAKKPAPVKRVRDASTQTEKQKNVSFRLDVYTQTDRVHSTAKVGCQVKTTGTAEIPVGKVGTVVKLPAPARAAMKSAAEIPVGKVGTVVKLPAPARAAMKSVAEIPVGKVGTVVKLPAPASAPVKSAVDVKSEANITGEESTLCRTLKLWKKRFSLFSRFELGVMLDEGSFHSMCPEMVAAHMASRCAFGTVVDPFCGAGGIAIQLALTCRKVIAVDMDPERIKLARENAAIYGVDRRIDFRVGDSYQILAEIKADAVVTSPPWEGKFHAKDIGSEKECGLAGVLKMAHKIAPRVVLHLPKTIDRTQCLRVARKAKFGRVEFEDVIVNGSTNSMNMYLKSRQNNSSLGPAAAIASSVNLIFPKNEKKCNNGLDYYVSYLNRTKEFLATH